MSSCWGTPYRLSDDDVSLTSSGGTLHSCSDLARLSAGNRTYVLPLGQKVSTPKGVVEVSSLIEGESRVAFISKAPVEFGDKHLPATSFLLGVMSCSYDPNYRMISSKVWGEEFRQKILDSIPQVTKELEMEQKWALYPNFVRSASTDGTTTWMLTSPIFDDVISKSKSLGLISETYRDIIEMHICSKTSVMQWMLAHTQSMSSPDATPKLINILEKLNMSDVSSIEDFAEGDTPVVLQDSDFVLVDSVTREESPLAVMKFDMPWWVYPPLEENPVTGGLLCASSNIVTLG